MITREKTVDEVLKEVQKIDNYVMERTKGLLIKNKKKLESRTFKHNDILSASNYTIPDTNDSVVVFAIKHTMELKGKECATMNPVYYIKTCYGTYILPSIDFYKSKVFRYVEFSSHSVDRIRERLGKDFDMFFREDYIKRNGCAFHPVKYDFNGDENEYVAHVGDAFIILEEEDSGKKHTVKTILDSDPLHCNQLVLKLDSKRKAESVLNNMYDFEKGFDAAHFKTLKRAGVIRTIA